MQLYSRRTDKAAKNAAYAGSRFREGAQSLADSKDELLSAFQDLISEGKTFLKSTSGMSGEAVEDARERFSSRLAEARSRWGGVSDNARVKGRRAVLAADEYVRESPWIAVGAAAVLTFVVALFASRR